MLNFRYTLYPKVWCGYFTKNLFFSNLKTNKLLCLNPPMQTSSKHNQQSLPCKYKWLFWWVLYESTLRSLRSRCRSSEPRTSCRMNISLYSQRLRCSSQAATSSVPQRWTVRDGKAGTLNTPKPRGKVVKKMISSKHQSSTKMKGKTILTYLRKNSSLIPK